MSKGIIFWNILTMTNMAIRLIIIIGLVLFSFPELLAKHIVGGIMTYECLGNDEYEFTLFVYRDCNCELRGERCGELDAEASIGIYTCPPGTNCDNLNLNQRDTYMSLLTPLIEEREVEAPDYPCLIPPDICVQEGFYKFRVTLPKSANSYYVAYQRCCRNGTISNILNPDDFGSTYMVEILPVAQDSCNSSPVFNNFPPTVICGDFPFEFDHSATDPDGDQLVYEFCAPLDGGGPDDRIAPRSCAGSTPTPACPPPYRTINYILPTYSVRAPLAGDPVVRIDPNTGIISGTPNVLGQFVVSVCVSEYRNGVLLSRIYRDFQFNVASCDATVFARIGGEEIRDGEEFLIRSCGENTVTIDNQSFQRSFIDVTQWKFPIEGGDTLRSGEWSPTITFPKVGTYEGTLILNPGSNECSDTADVVIEVLPDVTADFEFEYDTCVAGPVEFTDLSVSGADIITDWNWEFGDGNSSFAQNPRHTYRIPGDLPVSLTITDINNCEETVTKTIPYFPVPELIVVSPEGFNGCAPAEVFFNNLSVPIDETYDIRWDFGDGGTGDAVSPIYLYENAGTYTVTLDLTSPIGCETDTTFSELITLLPSPEAGFTFLPREPNNLQPTVTFTDQSSGAISWDWQFGPLARSRDQNPIFTFPDTGRVEISQIVTHPSGCRDTSIQFIDITPVVKYFLPNAFTPNADSVNDTFRGIGILEGAENFEMSIWNRWGEMVFQTGDPDEGWNGRKFNTEQDSPAGVYLVVVTYTEPRGDRIQLKGFATLIR